LISRLGDADARTARNDLLDAAAGLVKFDAEMKLLDSWARHEQNPTQRQTGRWTSL
jgi:hypothetical protein